MEGIELYSDAIYFNDRTKCQMLEPIGDYFMQRNILVVSTVNDSASDNFVV
jgi:hypothetical protein